jgi:hypothetical protein
MVLWEGLSRCVAKLCDWKRKITCHRWIALQQRKMFSPVSLRAGEGQQGEEKGQVWKFLTLATRDSSLGWPDWLEFGGDSSHGCGLRILCRRLQKVRLTWAWGKGLV